MDENNVCRVSSSSGCTWLSLLVLACASVGNTDRHKGLNNSKQKKEGNCAASGTTLNSPRDVLTFVVCL